MKFAYRINQILSWIEERSLIRAIRSGLLTMTPVLIIGAFALILQTFPVGVYQRFIADFAGGFLLSLFQFVFSATFGVLSVYMTYSISRAYMRLHARSGVPETGAVIAAFLSFFLLSGVYLEDFGTGSMGAKSMFLAILTGLGASALYTKLFQLTKRRHLQLYSVGADREFNKMLSMLVPIALTAIVFALVNAVFVYVFDVESFRMLLVKGFNRLFEIGDSSFWKGFSYVLVSSVLWFFGIHGSDVLESVAETYFIPGLAANQAAVAAGGVPDVILTKQFFDCFVLMGGCGATICLLISLLLFSRSRASRSLGVAAAFPMIFNINEMMVFGLPIVFNPVMLIPFITVPVTCYVIAYLAVSTGLVPVVTGDVAWTTPILIGGYYATGSLAGCALQLCNVAVGVLIYTPFVRMMDHAASKKSRQEYASFMKYFQKNEQEFTGMRLVEENSVYGEFAKALCAELQHDLAEYVVLAYQPQYLYDGRCAGVEALLRWRHPVYGLLYPPLVIKLAEEGGFLPELEEAVLKQALQDRPELMKRYGDGLKISVNVTGMTVVTARYLQFCRNLNAKDAFAGKNICLEVTEQAALEFNADTISALRAFREMGFMLAIDDFSMGQTSINYLKDDLFQMIKLDGSLVKGILTNSNCREIISSIAKLAGNLNLVIVAEYVETEEQREALHEIGCDCYQGYLYSKALFLNEDQ